MLEKKNLHQLLENEFHECCNRYVFDFSVPRVDVSEDFSPPRENLALCQARKSVHRSFPLVSNQLENGSSPRSFFPQNKLGQLSELSYPICYILKSRKEGSSNRHRRHQLWPPLIIVAGFSRRPLSPYPTLTAECTISIIIIIIIVSPRVLCTFHRGR